jgi:hypothetical protein
MRMTGVLLDVDVSRDGVVLVDMADAVKAHLVMAARANHAVAVDHPIQPLMKSGPAVRAPNADFVMLDFVGVKIGHGRPFAAKMRQKGCR